MKKDINVTLGLRIKQLRKERGYTRETFAEKIDVSSRFLADLESGKVGVSISTLKQIALEMNVSSDFLIGISGSEKYNPEKEGLIMKINKIPREHLRQVSRIIDCILEIENKNENNSV